MRILSCGETFLAARVLLRQRLPPEANGEFCVWPDRSVSIDLRNVDVLIPMIFRIDAAVMDTASFRLIQQWGSGGCQRAYVGHRCRVGGA